MERFKIYWLPFAVALLFLSLLLEKQGEAIGAKQKIHESVFTQKNLNYSHSYIKSGFATTRDKRYTLNRKFFKNNNTKTVELKDTVTIKNLYPGIN